MVIETMEFTIHRDESPTLVSGSMHYFKRLEEGNWALVGHPRYPETFEEREQGVSLARVMVEQNKNVKFNYENWNCEHFVSYILLGEEESLQVLNIKRMSFVAKAKLRLDHLKASKGIKVTAKNKTLF